MYGHAIGSVTYLPWLWHLLRCWPLAQELMEEPEQL